MYIPSLCVAGALLNPKNLHNTHMIDIFKTIRIMDNKVINGNLLSKSSILIDIRTNNEK